MSTVMTYVRVNLRNTQLVGILQLFLTKADKIAALGILLLILSTLH